MPCKHTAFSDSLLFTLLITSDKHCQNTHHRCVMSMCVFPTCALCECMCVTPANKACCAVAALLCVTRYMSVYHAHVHENINAWTHTRAHRHTTTSKLLLPSCEGFDIRLPAADAAANANAAQSLKQQWKTATNMTQRQMKLHTAEELPPRKDNGGKYSL